MFTENTGERFFSRRFFCEETFKTLGVETLSDALDYSLQGFDFPVYVALTNIPVGELLTGFAMRSDPNVVFG